MISGRFNFLSPSLALHRLIFSHSNHIIDFKLKDAEAIRNKPMVFSDVIQYACVEWILYAENGRVYAYTQTQAHVRRYKVKHRDRSVHAILHYLLDNKCCKGIRYLLSNIKFMRIGLCLSARSRFSIYSIHSFVCLLFFFHSLFQMCSTNDRFATEK